MGENGLVVAPDDAGALAAALKRADTDHELRARAAAYNRPWVAEDASWEHAVAGGIAGEPGRGGARMSADPRVGLMSAPRRRSRSARPGSSQKGSASSGSSLRRARCRDDLGVLTAGLTAFASLACSAMAAPLGITRYVGANPAATWPAYLGRHSGATDRRHRSRSGSRVGVRRRSCTTSPPGR